MIWVSYTSDTCASPVATGETVSGYIHRVRDQYILLLLSMLRFRSGWQPGEEDGPCRILNVYGPGLWLSFSLNASKYITGSIPVLCIWPWTVGNWGTAIVLYFLPVRRSIAPAFRVLIPTFDNTDLASPRARPRTVPPSKLHILNAVLDGPTIHFSLQR